MKTFNRKGRPPKVEDLGDKYAVKVKGRVYKFHKDSFNALPMPPDGDTADQTYARMVIESKHYA